jgi:DUF438 domain-containing protein
MNLKELSIESIEVLMDTLPVDVSFVDADDRVKFFNTPKKGRLFPRTKMDLGREVQKCHPPKSVHIVEKILKDFKDGTSDSTSFWIDMKGKKILIEYFSVRDASGKYLGTLEVSQDITDIQKITGEKRILD